MAATRPQDAERILPSRGDPIRIVPLDLPHDWRAPTVEGAAPTAPRLVYRNGPLIAAVDVFTIFWGPAWQREQEQLAAQLNQFFDFIVSSALIDQLGEYSVPAYKIGHGTYAGTATLATPKLGASVSDTAIQHMLQGRISAGQVPPSTPNTLYFVFLPSGVKAVQGGSASCQAFCGYHNDIAGQIFYAVMPYPGCKGCTGSLSTLDALTSTSSHELCEAITDPIPGRGWYDDANGEIGDICAWKTKRVGEYIVQLEWSNKRRRCV